MKESMIIYRSFVVAGKKIKNKNQRLAYYEAIFDFGLDEKEPALDDVADAVFEVVKPQIIANNTRYSNGLKGGRKKKNQSETEIKPKVNQNETKLKPNENVNVNVNENDNVNVNVNSKEDEEKKDSELPKKSLFDSFESEFARPLSPIEVQTIASFCESFTDELILFALKESVMNGVRSLKYIGTILNNWKASNIQTVAEAQKQIERFKTTKKCANERKIPEWYGSGDENIESASSETLSELDVILAGLKG